MSDTKPVDADVLDPDIRHFVTTLNEGYGRYPNFDKLPLRDRRAVAEQLRARWSAGGPAMWRSIDTPIAGRRGRIHIPFESPALGAMLYLHGGGWTMFSIDTHDRLMREYAARAGIIVVGIDYSLSPEAKFPAALNEVVEALDWLRRAGAAHGIDPKRLAVGGDSAGANLALAAALKLREDDGTRLRGMLFNYGAFGPEPTPSFKLYDGPRYMLTVEEMCCFWANYTREPSDLQNPLAAPALADVRGLPAAYFCIAECDILSDGNRAMAQRLAAAGVPIEEHIYEGATHSFLEAVSISALADRALDAAARWLNGRLIEG
ncbi:MAG TPA: alpha/beta hydrolase fold domain-containing protein [Steroidobacteraceae bacterium]|nr:alpha/beta hydrolase fold domain-containing protein [Steroidobacteraceae bacterium]